MSCRSFLAALLGLAIAVCGQAPVQAFRSLSGSFQLELPVGWRALAPNEALRIGENALAPALLGKAQPGIFYAIGPVDEWLAGTFSSPWLYVVEQDNEWQLDDDFAARLVDLWRRQGQNQGVEYELADIQRTSAGNPPRQVLIARRTATPRPPHEPLTSLDVHAPVGGRQVTLSFTSAASAFDVWQPEFRRWLQTLTFARQARGEQTLSDRLWTPIVTGAVVGIVLLLLYKHTHRR